jgi:hypothetical protein
MTEGDTEEIRNIIIQLDNIKRRRHILRCKLINFIKKNYILYPDNFSTGRLFHQRNRKQVLKNHVVSNHLGDICDKELIKDSAILINEIMINQ